MSYVKLKLTATGMDSFHGDLAGEKFENGISVNAMPVWLADRIAAANEAMVIDDEGNDLHQAGEAHRMVSGSCVAAEMPERMRVMTEEEHVAALARQAALRQEERTFYSTEQLEAIAVKEGINGLREIATPWGVKDRKIDGLIRAIVRAQAQYSAIAKQIEREKAEQGQRAEQESIAAEATRRQEVIDQGRHWSPDVEKFETIAEREARLKKDATPNAIGADGQPVYVDPDKPKLVENLEANRDGDHIKVESNDVVTEGGAVTFSSVTVTLDPTNAGQVSTTEIPANVEKAS